MAENCKSKVTICGDQTEDCLDKQHDARRSGIASILAKPLRESNHIPPTLPPIFFQKDFFKKLKAQ